MTVVPRRRRGPAWSCSGCGLLGVSAMARADLDTVWLMPGSGGPVARRFCRACVPAGPVGDVACVQCGDGQLLARELAGTDGWAASVVQGWLSGAGVSGLCR